jgi:hypothetical protein
MENVNPVLINLLGKLAADEAIGLTNDIWLCNYTQADNHWMPLLRQAVER